MVSRTVIIRSLGIQAYPPIWQAMKTFTDQRLATTLDELWLLEHFPVFTQGQNGKPEHILNPGDIPVIAIDRGGQVTYHGPGQIVIYPLVDIKRLNLGVRQLVSILEQSMIQLLADFNIVAHARCDAPGVYIEQAKIGSVGLRIRRGCSYHGLSFNVAMDLNPFQRINPCGYAQLAVTQLRNWLPEVDSQSIGTQLIQHLSTNLGYNEFIYQQNLDTLNPTDVTSI